MNPEILNTPIEYLKGVGPKRADILKSELFIYTFRDLSCYFPFRYIDRTTTKLIDQLIPGNSNVQLLVQITGIQEIGHARKKRLVATAKDQSGTIQLVWFKGIKWIKSSIQIGKTYVVFGKPNLYSGVWNLNHPEIELEIKNKNKIGELQPVYHSTEKLGSFGLHYKGIENLMRTLLANLLTSLELLFVI